MFLKATNSDNETSGDKMDGDLLGCLGLVLYQPTIGLAYVAKRRIDFSQWSATRPVLTVLASCPQPRRFRPLRSRTCIIPSRRFGSKTRSTFSDLDVITTSSFGSPARHSTRFESAFASSARQPFPEIDQSESNAITLQDFSIDLGPTRTQRGSSLYE